MLQGKHIIKAAAAKRHTVVLTAGGGVYQWGHGIVTPRRVVLAGMESEYPFNQLHLSDTSRMFCTEFLRSTEFQRSICGSIVVLFLSLMGCSKNQQNKTRLA